MRWFRRPPLATPHDDGGDGDKENMGSALTMPALGIDPDWRERVELAKREYAGAKKRRRGKPTFRMSEPLRLGDGPNA